MMLSKAIHDRNCLLLLDGIDEGGVLRDEIESHVAEVIQRQGFLMLVTSRPAGLNEESFQQCFHMLQLQPLEDSQQEEVILGRLQGRDSKMVEELLTCARLKVI